MAAKGLGNQLAFGTGNDVTDRRLDLKIEKNTSMWGARMVAITWFLLNHILTEAEWKGEIQPFCQVFLSYRSLNANRTMYVD